MNLNKSIINKIYTTNYDLPYVKVILLFQYLLGIDYHTVFTKKIFWSEKMLPIEQENELIEYL